MLPRVGHGFLRSVWVLFLYTLVEIFFFFLTMTSRNWIFPSLSFSMVNCIDGCCVLRWCTWWKLSSSSSPCTNVSSIYLIQGLVCSSYCWLQSFQLECLHKDVCYHTNLICGLTLNPIWSPFLSVYLVPCYISQLATVPLLFFKFSSCPINIILYIICLSVPLFISCELVQ